MSKERYEVPIPEEKFIDEEIQLILRKGLDPKASFWSYLVGMYKQVGLKFIFRDFAEILFTIVIAMVAASALIVGAAETPMMREINLYTLIFAWSPMTYLVMAYLFFMIQKKKPAYEVEMTCKYNLHQMSALRMLVFSIISMIVNGLIISLLMLEHKVNFLYALLLSSSSLFLFALAFLYVMLRTHSGLSKLILFVGWMGGNLLASYYSHEYYLHVLKQIPFYVYGIIVVTGLVLYVKNLKRLLFSRNMKGLI